MTGFVIKAFQIGRLVIEHRQKIVGHLANAFHKQLQDNRVLLLLGTATLCQAQS
jgi:hypothetical protein